MSTSTHSVAPEEVMAFLDGELSADRAAFVSAHIKECSACHQRAAALDHSSSSLAKWTVRAAPGSFKEGVLHRSNSSKTLPAGKAISDLRRFPYRRSRLAWGGGVVLALLILFSLNPVHAPRMAADRAASAHNVSVDHPPDVPITTGSGLPPASPMIARTVSLSLVVKDFDRGRASLDAILALHNGYAASLGVSSPQGAARVIQASLRIPAPQWASALDELKSLGRVEGETQNGEEVTQQHADLVARIKNERETELRLQDILRTRTGKVKDVLDVEQEIARVRGEIEQMEAAQKTLEHRVDFATIDLQLAEEYKAQLNTPAPSVLIELRNASISGFRNAFESLLALVLFLAESGPSFLFWLALVGIPTWCLWRRYRAQSLGSFARA